MPLRGRIAVGASLVSSLLFTPFASAASSVAVQGAEFQVNVRTVLYQDAADLGVDADGDFVVVWRDSINGDDIRARRFDASGIAASGEFQINQRTISAQKAPAIAVAPGGSFVVVWQSDSQDGSGTGIFGRVFAADGAPQALEFQVNSSTAGDQAAPDVAMGTDGRFVVAWQSRPGADWDIRASVFDAYGYRETSDLQINSYGTGDQTSPSVAVHPVHEEFETFESFVVAWESLGQDGDGAGTFTRVFGEHSSDWEADTNEIQVADFTPNSQHRPAVAMDATRHFVVAFEAPVNGADGAIMQRWFNGVGQPQDGSDAVVSDFEGAQTYPSIAMRDDGRYLVVWHDNTGKGGGTIEGRSFLATGEAEGAEFHIANGAPLPVLGANDSGRFVVAWSGYDGHYGGVFARRLLQPTSYDVDGNGTLDPLTDGILLLRFFFDFTGNTLINGAVAPDCTRCTAPEIIDHITRHL